MTTTANTSATAQPAPAAAAGVVGRPAAETRPSRLEAALAAAGRPLLVPYLTGGVTADWTDYLLAYQQSGADAVEIGLPFSDPMLDGSTIQQASDQALARGATVSSTLAQLTAIRARITVPIVVMTYANLVLRSPGFCRRLAAAGVCGLIVPDLPVDELGDVSAEAAAAGVDLVLLVAPSTTPERLREICAQSRGYVYAVSVMGTTGERIALAASAAELAARVKAVTSKPVLIGFGISTPAHAAEAGRAGDGVIVASALMRRVLDGATPAEVGTEVAAMREAMEVRAATAYTEIPGHRG